MRWLCILVLAACEKPTPPAPPPPLPPCIVDGIYTLASDASWTCTPKERAFGMYTPFQIFALRVKTVGDKVEIDRVEPDPPYEKMRGDITTTKTDCTVKLSMTEGRRMAATLWFGGKGFTGLAYMEYSGADSGGWWQCQVSHAKFVGTRLEL